MPKLAAFPKAYVDQLCIDGSMSIRQWIELAATLDIDGLEFYAGFLGLGAPHACRESRAIAADHGLAIIYFLQSDVVTTLLAAGVEIVLLTDDETKNKIAARFSRPGRIFWAAIVSAGMSHRKWPANSRRRAKASHCWCCLIALHPTAAMRGSTGGAPSGFWILGEI